MATLKELRTRRNSVQSTKKITSAMKMIAAAKLKKAQDQVESGRPYTDLMSQMLGALLMKTTSFEVSPPLLVGSGKYDSYLLVVIASDRGLCGGFNHNVIREAVQRAQKNLENGKDLKILCVGKRARDMLKKDFDDHIIETYPAFARPTFKDASVIAEKILELFEKGEIDVCRLVYNDFVSPLTQTVSTHQLIPFEAMEEQEETIEKAQEERLHDQFIYEPGEEQILNALLPRNVAVQIYRALMENAASEHGARMTAMDNATRNASDMIDKLTLTYNRSRQAQITKELIEIVSGAEAL